MHEIDLIPLDYRTQLIKLKMVKQFGIISAVLLLLSTSGYATLGYTTQQLKSEASRLQKQKEISAQQRSSLIQIQEQKGKLQQQLKLLQGLRSGAAVETMFEAIDSALPEDVWFSSWKFQRTGVVEVKPKTKTVNSGYFIVVPQGEADKKPTGTLLQTNMTIVGQARDHSALSKFVRALFKQSEIHDVRVVKTSLRRYSTTSVVDFDLAVIVNSKLRIN